MQTFKVRVACDLYGSKHNAMFLFKPPPVSLNEVVAEAQRFYQDEAAKRAPAGLQGAAFQVGALQMYNPTTTRWEDVADVAQLTDGCQLYAFPSAPPQAEHQKPPEALQAPQAPQAPQSKTQAPLLRESREGIAFDVLDIKHDGVITLDEMMESFRKLGLRFTPSQVQDFFLVADENGDGVVTGAEFQSFALRFPTVIDSIHQKRSDDEVQEREEAVLREAEAQLHAEQEVEQRLLTEAAAASKRVRDLMGQIADHRLSHEVQLQRKPIVEAQQQQLIEQELALAAQKERLKQVQDDIRRDIEGQLRHVTASLGLKQAPQPAAAAASSPAYSHGAPAPLAVAGGAQEPALLRSVSENSSSFFLPSEPHTARDAKLDVPQRLAIDTEVEACNFDVKPEFNGLRGKVTALHPDGKVAVQFFVRGGLNLDMLQSNIQPVAPSSPPLGGEVEATGPGSSPQTGLVDLRGSKGSVVGVRNGALLCEFPPRAGIFEVKPQHISTAAQGGPLSIQQAVQNEIARKAGGDAPFQAQQVSQGAGMAAELEKARREAAGLRKEVEQARRGAAPTSPAAGGLSPASPEAAAALNRLGGLGLGSQSPNHISAMPLSPLTAYPPPSMPYVGQYGTSGEYGSLLPSTQEILRKVGASMSPSGAPITAHPSLPKQQSYALGPIDPSTL